MDVQVLAQAILKAVKDAPAPTTSNYIDSIEGLTDVIVDGHFDFIAIAESVIADMEAP